MLVISLRPRRIRWFTFLYLPLTLSGCDEKIAIDPNLLTSNAQVDDLRTYHVVSKSEIKQFGSAYGDFILDYQLTRSQQESGLRVFNIRPEYFLASFGGQIIDSNESASTTMGQFISAFQEGFELTSNVKQGNILSLRANNDMMRDVLSNVPRNQATNLEKQFHVPMIPVNITAKLGEQRQISILNDQPMVFTVIRLTPKIATLSLTSNSPLDRSCIATSSGTNEQPNSDSDDTLFYEAIMTIDRDSGWINKFVIAANSCQVADGEDIQIEEYEAMYSTGGFRTSHMNKSLPPSDLLSKYTEYNYSPAKQSSESKKEALSEDYGVLLVNPYSEDLNLIYKGDPKYLDLVQFRDFSYQLGHNSPDVKQIRVFHDDKDHDQPENYNLTAKSGDYQPSNVSSVKATADYFGYTLEAHSLPLDPTKSTSIIAGNTEAILTPNKEKENTFTLKLYGSNQEEVLWQNIPELEGAQVRQLIISSLNQGSLTQQFLLGQAENLIAYEIIFPNGQALPDSLSLMQRVINDEPTFSKEIIFFGAKGGVENPKFPAFSSYRDPDTKQAHPELNNHQLLMHWTFAQSYFCELSANSPKLNGHSFTWRPGIVTTDSSGLPIPPVTRLVTDDHQREAFYDRNVEVHLNCPGTFNYKPIKLTKVEFPWMVNIKDLPDFERSMSVPEFKGRYRFVDKDGLGLDVLTYMSAGSELTQVDSIGSALKDNQYLKLNGQVHQAYQVTIGGEATTQTWMETFPPLLP